jgi:hypothetical protein
MGMIGAALLKNPPAGYQPPGWTPPKTGAAAQRSTRDYAPSEMVRTPTFLALWVAYCLGATAGLMVISQLVPFARAAGLTAAAATFAITIGVMRPALPSAASYLIGLMNVADRSLAMVDYALRRRFVFITLNPQYENELYRQWLLDRAMQPELVNLIIERLSALN